MMFQENCDNGMLVCSDAFSKTFPGGLITWRVRAARDYSGLWGQSHQGDLGAGRMHRPEAESIK
jgi:hypothetical protein